MDVLSSKKGQVGFSMVMGLVVFIITVAFALLVIGGVENSTVGDCVAGTSTYHNSTDLLSGGVHNFLTPSSVGKYDGTLVIAYEWNGTTTVYANGHSLGTLDGTSPDTFTVNGGYVSTKTGMNYSVASGKTNITDANLTYYRLANCSVDITAYEQIAEANSTTYNSFSLLNSGILVFIGIILLGFVALLKSG